MPAAVIVFCGAPLTSRASDIVTCFVDGGWFVRVVGTPASSEWMSQDFLTEFEPQFEFRHPLQEKQPVDPDVVVVCPATFNTINKVTAGVSDNYATGLINEAVGMQKPTVLVPMVNNKLWGHPRWADSLKLLDRSAVLLLNVHTGRETPRPVESGSGAAVVDAFDPLWLLSAARSIR